MKTKPSITNQRLLAVNAVITRRVYSSLNVMNERISVSCTLLTPRVHNIKKRECRTPVIALTNALRKVNRIL